MQEYGRYFDMPTMCVRAGCISGPNHAGARMHGFLSYLMRCTITGRAYTVYGYGGKQVRDLLHIDDLVQLLDDQLTRPNSWDGLTVNVGGGRECSLSLLEATELCRELTGNEVPVEPIREERRGDVPVYISDCARLFEHTGWRPRRTARDTLADIAAWIAAHEDEIRSAL